MKLSHSELDSESLKKFLDIYSKICKYESVKGKDMIYSLSRNPNNPLKNKGFFANGGGVLL